MCRSLLLLLLVAGASPADPPKPSVVVQARDFAKLFDDYSRILTGVIGADGQKAFQERFQDDLGEKGLKGLDQLRPWLGYLLTTDNLEDTTFFLLVPFSKEADFLDLLDRWDITAEEVPGAAGLYELDLHGDSLFLRFHEKYAYFGINAKRAAMDAKTLLPAKALLDPNEVATIALTLYPDRLSKEWKAATTDTLGVILGQDFVFAEMAIPGTVLLEAVTRLEEFGKSLEPVRLTIHFDHDRGELVTELTAQAVKGTPLATAITNRKPAEYRFGALAGNAATVRLGWPQLSKPARDLVTEFGKRYSSFLALGLAGDTVLTPLGHTLFDSFKAAIAKNAADGVFALDGPDQDGRFAATLGLGLADTKKLDAAIRKFVTARTIDGDADVSAIQKAITLDAAKIGDVTVHTLKLGGLLPKEWQDLLGEKSEVVLALTPDAMVVTVGSDAIGRLKTALAAKPATSDPLTVTVLPKNLARLFEKFDVPSPFGASDKPLSLLSTTLSGGGAIKLRTALNLKLLAIFQAP